MFSAELAAPPEGRRLPRRAVQLPGQMASQGGWRALGRVVDLTRFGARIETATPMKKGAELFITLPAQPALRARVMWTDDLAAGFLFDKPLTAEAFKALVERYQIASHEDRIAAPRRG